MTNPKKRRGSLSAAFGDVVSRKESTAAPERQEQHDSREPDTGEVEMVPGRGGKLVPTNTPVNMTFTVTAKERYDWSLELKRRGLSAVSVLRETMNELLDEGK